MGLPAEIEAPPSFEYFQAVANEERERHRRKGPKFIWITCAIFLGWCLFRIHKANYSPSIYAFEPAPEPESGDGNVISCTKRDGWDSDSELILAMDHEEVEVVKKAFKLPVSAESLFFVARGDAAAGGIFFETVESDDNELSVEVELESHHVDSANVCALEGEDGSRGIALLTPKHKGKGPRRPRRPHRFPRYKFTVTVKIPTSNSKVLDLKALLTFLPMFKHELADLRGVSFGSLGLHGINGPILIESVNAVSGNISTINGPIVGQFNVTNSLRLATVNGPIEADINVENDVDKAKPSVIDLTTANGHIAAELSLFSTKSTGGLFKVLATTANGPIDVSFPTAPVSSVLNLKAVTANAHTDVSLHPTYEGVFHLNSVLLSPKLVVDADIEDPSGNGKERTVNAEGSKKGELSGEVFWGEKGDDTPAGSVEVRTTLAPNVLRLEDGKSRRDD